MIATYSMDSLRILNSTCYFTKVMKIIKVFCVKYGEKNVPYTM